MARDIPKALTEEEYKKLIKNTNKPKHKLSFMLGYESGLRVSEVTSLKPEDIDQKRNQISIHNSKRDKSRTVPIPKNFKPKHLKRLPINRSERTLQRWFNKALKKASLPQKYTFHSLRHGFAFRLADKGMNINFIQQLMGHEAAETTMIYMKARPKQAIDKYEEMF